MADKVGLLDSGLVMHLQQGVALSGIGAVFHTTGSHRPLINMAAGLLFRSTNLALIFKRANVCSGIAVPTRMMQLITVDRTASNSTKSHASRFKIPDFAHAETRAIFHIQQWDQMLPQPVLSLKLSQHLHQLVCRLWEQAHRMAMDLQLDLHK